jgi:hypothetical protein
MEMEGLGSGWIGRKLLFGGLQGMMKQVFEDHKKHVQM